MRKTLLTLAVSIFSIPSVFADAVLYPYKDTVVLYPDKTTVVEFITSKGRELLLVPKLGKMSAPPGSTQFIVLNKHGSAICWLNKYLSDKSEYSVSVLWKNNARKCTIKLIPGA